MFGLSTMGGVSGIMQALQQSPQGGQMLNNGMQNKGFSFMDAMGSAAAKMPSGGGGRNPHLVMNPNHGMDMYQDMGNPAQSMSPVFNMMNSLQTQQPQRQDMQMPMHPLVAQILRMSGVQ